MLIILEVFSIYFIIEHFVFNSTCTLDVFFIFSMWFSSFVFVFFLVIFCNCVVYCRDDVAQKAGSNCL